MLKHYYLELRGASAADPGSLPVTARQLESLVRLSEARARLELREEVTREDAEVRCHAEAGRERCGASWLAGWAGIPAISNQGLVWSPLLPSCPAPSLPPSLPAGRG